MQFQLNKPTWYVFGRQVIDSSVQETSNTELEDRTPYSLNIDYYVNEKPYYNYYGPVRLSFTSEYPSLDYSNYDTNLFLGEVNFPKNNIVENYAEIRYTVDGSIPNQNSKLYIEPVVLYYNLTGSEYTLIKAKVYYLGRSSEVITVNFSIYNSFLSPLSLPDAILYP